jgi:hypothetical protein
MVIRLPALTKRKLKSQARHPDYSVLYTPQGSDGLSVYTRDYGSQRLNAAYSILFVVTRVVLLSLERGLINMV